MDPPPLRISTDTWMLEKFLQLLQDNSGAGHDSRRSARIWSQQTGLPDHTSKLALQRLNGHFETRVLSRNSSTPWPAHSPYLTSWISFCVGTSSPRCTVGLQKSIQSGGGRPPRTPGCQPRFWRAGRSMRPGRVTASGSVGDRRPRGECT